MYEEVYHIQNLKKCGKLRENSYVQQNRELIIFIHKQSPYELVSEKQSNKNLGGKWLRNLQNRKCKQTVSYVRSLTQSKVNKTLGGHEMVRSPSVRNITD